MKQKWTMVELKEHWTLSSQEIRSSEVQIPKISLGFCLPTEIFSKEEIISLPVIDFISRLMGSLLSCSRSIKHRLKDQKKLLKKSFSLRYMIQEVTIEKATFQSPSLKFEAGTPNIAGIIGLDSAIDLLCFGSNERNRWFAYYRNLRKEIRAY